jgi:hypothetical protein
MRAHSARAFLPFCPATQQQKRALGLFRHAAIRARAEGPRLETGGHGVAPEALAVPHDDALPPRLDPRGPVIRLSRVLETRPIPCAIAPQDPRRPGRSPLVDLCAQGQRPRRGTMPWLACAHPPGQRQGAALVDHRPHPGDTPTPHDTALSPHDQRRQRPRRHQDLAGRDTISLRGALVVPEPPGTAFDTARGLSTIGPGRGPCGELRALPAPDPPEERRERGQVPGDSPCRLARLPLCSGVSYGTIPAEVVTHGRLLLDGSLLPESRR